MTHAALYPPAIDTESDETPAVALPLCDDCAEPTDETWSTASGSDVCEDCRDNYSQCDDCGQYSEDTFSTSGYGTVCESCAQDYTSCDRCGDLDNDTNRTWDGEDICDSCTSRYYWRCSDCYMFVSDNLVSCPDCPDEEDASDVEGIHSYSYKPYPEFHGAGPSYFGVELEVEIDGSLSQAAGVALDHLGRLGYLKSDSTINHGFEIVTHPMSHAYAVESFPWGMLHDLAQVGAEAAESTGLHIHVSRAAFTDAQHIYRWMKLLHRNSDDVTRIARRDSGEWAAWTESARKSVKDYAKGPHRGYAPRYSAINVNNSATFEVRVFASTLNVTELRGALDLMAASVEYTRQLTCSAIVKGNGWSWGAFIAWAADQGQYSALVEMSTSNVYA